MLLVTMFDRNIYTRKFSADDLTIQAPSGSAGGITIRSDSDQGSYIYFADGTNGNEQYSGFIQYLHGSDYFKFRNRRSG